VTGNSQSVVGERWIEEGTSERRYLNFTLRSEPRIAGYKVMATVCGPPPAALVGLKADCLGASFAEPCARGGGHHVI